MVNITLDIESRKTIMDENNKPSFFIFSLVDKNFEKNSNPSILINEAIDRGLVNIKMESITSMIVDNNSDHYIIIPKYSVIEADERTQDRVCLEDYLIQPFETNVMIDKLLCGNIHAGVTGSFAKGITCLPVFSNCGLSFLEGKSNRLDLENINTLHRLECMIDSDEYNGNYFTKEQFDVLDKTFSPIPQILFGADLDSETFTIMFSNGIAALPYIILHPSDDIPSITINGNLSLQHLEEQYSVLRDVFSTYKEMLPFLEIIDLDYMLRRLYALISKLLKHLAKERYSRATIHSIIDELYDLRPQIIEKCSFYLNYNGRIKAITSVEGARTAFRDGVYTSENIQSKLWNWIDSKFGENSYGIYRGLTSYQTDGLDKPMAKMDQNEIGFCIVDFEGRISIVEYGIPEYWSVVRPYILEGLNINNQLVRNHKSKKLDTDEMKYKVITNVKKYIRTRKSKFD